MYMVGEMTAQITGICERRAAAGLDAPLHGVELVGGPGDEQDLGARIAQPVGQRLSDSARRAGDPDGAAGDPLLQCPIVDTAHRRSLPEARQCAVEIPDYSSIARR